MGDPRRRASRDGPTDVLQGLSSRAMAQTPYRGGPGGRASTAPEQTGLVADLIEQFADPLAFFRELVQNAIDAGSESITVRIAWDEGTARISVRDAGVGMSREVIEEELLVLFRSGKEGRDDAIGKFGVGFVSVLAVSPELVEVRTATGSGVGHVVHLRSDQTWDLFEVQGGSESGTTVTLHVPTPAEALGQLIVDAENALSRWCRHARVPIRYVALDPEGTLIREARIDRPLSLEDALVSVEVQRGDTRAVVGKHAGGRTYCGFFNRGLTLWETDAPMMGPVSFKVQDPHLEHTLSRDNVRRDAAFERAIDVVRSAVTNELGKAMIDALADAAVTDRERYRALLFEIDPNDVNVPKRRWVFPLIEAVGGSAIATGAEPIDLCAVRSSELTAALAKQQIGVLDARGLDTSGAEALLLLVARITGRRPPRDAHRVYTLIADAPPKPLDDALLASVSDILDDVARAPSSIRFARLVGAGERRICIAGGEVSEPWLVADEMNDDPLRLVARPPLVLNTRVSIVHAAREAMSAEPEVAAAFLARAILLSTGRLDAKRDEALTTGAIERLLGGGR